MLAAHSHRFYTAVFAIVDGLDGDPPLAAIRPWTRHSFPSMIGDLPPAVARIAEEAVVTGALEVAVAG